MTGVEWRTHPSTHILDSLQDRQRHFRLQGRHRHYRLQGRHRHNAIVICRVGGSRWLPIKAKSCIGHHSLPYEAATYFHVLINLCCIFAREGKSWDGHPSLPCVAATHFHVGLHQMACRGEPQH